jgi:hypothetical protein
MPVRAAITFGSPICRVKGRGRTGPMPDGLAVAADGAHRGRLQAVLREQVERGAGEQLADQVVELPELVDRVDVGPAAQAPGVARRRSRAAERRRQGDAAGGQHAEAACGDFREHGVDSVHRGPGD